MRILLIAVLVLLFIGCSKQHKAERLIDEYLKQHLNDYNSYQAVKTGNIDTVYKNYLIDDTLGKSLFNLFLSKKRLVDAEDSLLNQYLNKPLELYSPAYEKVLESRLKKNEKSFKEMAILLQKSKSEYKKHFKEWSVKQSYRAKNGLGALILHESTFYIDSAFTRVTHADD